MTAAAQWIVRYLTFAAALAAMIATLSPPAAADHHDKQPGAGC